MTGSDSHAAADSAEHRRANRTKSSPSTKTAPPAPAASSSATSGGSGAASRASLTPATPNGLPAATHSASRVVTLPTTTGEPTLPRPTPAATTTSGGTTGEPIELIHDEDFKIRSSAAIQAFSEIGDSYAGNKKIRLWGEENLILRGKQGYFNNIKNIYLKNTFFQNAFRLSVAKIKKYIKEINLIKPRVIYTYVHSIYEMARIIKRYKLNITSVDSIITTAGVLTNKMRNFIENIFKCRVFNFYGSRETSFTGISCKNSNKIHINMYQKYIEIVDNNGKALKEHNAGDLIITPLFNYIMPLIRYKIGDKGSIDYNPCSCGRGLIRLESVIGRTVDIFKNKRGELIDGEYFTHLFYFLKNIKRFQIIQEKIDEININIVTFDKNQFKKSIETDLSSKIKFVMGNDCKIVFNYVSNIEQSLSGKIRYTISKIS